MASVEEAGKSMKLEVSQTKFLRASDAMQEKRLLADGFLRSCAQFPSRPAINVAGRDVTYQEVRDRALRVAATIQSQSVASAAPLTAVLAYRSETAYVAVLGALMAGHGYVPLNPTFPVQRTRSMLERSACRSLIVDCQSEPQLEAVLGDTKRQMLLIFPDIDDIRGAVKRWPGHIVLGRNDLELAAAWSPATVSSDAIAYLLFTSGSTGSPKGVMVSHRNVRHYVGWAVRRYQFTETDRVSQNFDMTFDLSVHDMFVAWERGACVCCPTQKQLFKPNSFINDARLTVWFSVPSTAVLMRRMGLLKPELYPRLRLSLFCGEGLLTQTACDWAAAAPNSILENLYGPTELTIACTAYRWNGERSIDDCEREIVSIGEPFPGLDAIIVDENLNQVPVGVAGELLVSGPQTALGYWQDPARTAKAFITPPGKRQTYYRTGDRVRRPASDKPLVYLGRLDNQIKVLGHRVELGEIEAEIRRISGTESVAAFGWPLTANGPEGVEVFLQADETDTRALVEGLKTTLPSYMVPRKIHVLPKLPINSNGKLNRTALVALLGEIG